VVAFSHGFCLGPPPLRGAKVWQFSMAEKMQTKPGWSPRPLKRWRASSFLRTRQSDRNSIFSCAAAASASARSRRASVMGWAKVLSSKQPRPRRPNSPASAPAWQSSLQASADDHPLQARQRADQLGAIAHFDPAAFVAQVIHVPTLQRTLGFGFAELELELLGSPFDLGHRSITAHTRFCSPFRAGFSGDRKVRGVHNHRRSLSSKRL